MKSVQKIDLGLTGYDELFMNDAERKENKLPRIYDIPLSEMIKHFLFIAIILTMKILILLRSNMQVLLFATIVI